MSADLPEPMPLFLPPVFAEPQPKATTVEPPPSSGQQLERDTFVSFRTALALDDKCHFLKYFERAYVWPIEEKLLEPLNFSKARKAEKISAEDYQAEYDAIDAEAVSAAAGIECTDGARAGAVITPLRGEIAPLVYADLIIAYEKGNLTAEQQNAARAFEAMVFPLYGEANWPNFVQFAGAKASQLLETADREDGGPDYLQGLGIEMGGLGGNGGYVGTDDFSAAYLGGAATYARDRQVEASVEVADRIFFEMVAEQFGYRRLENLAKDFYAYRDQMADMNLNPVMDLWEQPGLFEAVDTGARFYAAFTVSPEGAVRVMTFGEGAAPMSTGKVVFMVHGALPEDAGDQFSYIRSPQWWAGAQRFEGELVDETCLGGPCFALPPEIMDAIAAQPPGHEFRFFFNGGTTTNDPNPDDELVQSGWGYKVSYRNEMIAAGL